MHTINRAARTYWQWNARRAWPVVKDAAPALLLALAVLLLLTAR